MKSERLHRLQWVLSLMTLAAFITRWVLDRPLAAVLVLLVLQAWFSIKSYRSVYRHSARFLNLLVSRK